MKQKANSRVHVPSGLAEMLTRADAPVALGSSLERRVLSMYQIAQGAFRQYAAVDAVPDLRDVQSLRLDSNDELDRLGEREPYRDGEFTEASASWRVVKYGKILNITKEMRLNDDTRALFNLANEYGRIAARTEGKVGPALLESLPVTTDGSGAISGTLNEALIERMFNVFADRETAGGKKIEVNPAIMVYHPVRQVALNTIFRPSTAGDYNPLSGYLPAGGFVPERYLTNKARIYLMASPLEWPTLEIDFLRSRLDPREDYTNGPRVIPDSVQPLSFLPGDIGGAGEGFRYDSMSFKVTHFMGGAFVDPDKLGIVVGEVA